MYVQGLKLTTRIFSLWQIFLVGIKFEACTTELAQHNHIFLSLLKSGLLKDMIPPQQQQES